MGLFNSFIYCDPHRSCDDFWLAVRPDCRNKLYFSPYNVALLLVIILSRNKIFYESFSRKNNAG